MSESEGTTEDVRDPAQRVQQLGLFCAVLLGAALGYGAYWLQYERHYERTDNAYVGGKVVQITPQIAGMTTSVAVDDTQRVSAGDRLVQLDATDAKLALAQAEADLAQTVRQVQTLYANDEQLGASFRLRQDDVTRAQQDVARRLAAGGAVSKEEVQHARSALVAAMAGREVAHAQLQSNRLLVGSGALAQHPNVQQAAARVRAAYLNLARTTIVSPIDGYIAQRSVQVGQRVAPGSILMAVVPLREVWVDANFTEVRLRRVRVGQPVALTADLYGNSVVFRGRVLGFSPGTGAAFSLLPAQNATGNWIKVVQRLPVRIALDPRQLDAHPLSIGLSMQVTIDVHEQRGSPVSATPRVPADALDPYEKQSAEADALVSHLIAENTQR